MGSRRRCPSGFARNGPHSPVYGADQGEMWNWPMAVSRDHQEALTAPRPSAVLDFTGPGPWGRDAAVHRDPPATAPLRLCTTSTRARRRSANGSTSGPPRGTDGEPGRLRCLIPPGQGHGVAALLSIESVCDGPGRLCTAPIRPRREDDRRRNIGAANRH